MSVELIKGDCVAAMSQMVQESVDSIVTDPPYHFASIVKRFGADDAAPARSDGATGVYERSSRGFMGKTWDGGDVAFRPETWAAALRVLKPGGHLVAFGASKNYHRLACAIEDAGFEIRDSLMWVFGSGFPKSLDVSKAIDKAAGAERALTRPGVVKRDGYGEDWDTGSSTDRPRYDEPATDDAREWQGWGTALKPAYEPIILARKPLIGTVAENVLAHGTGAINVDGCRVNPGEVVSGGGNGKASHGGRFASGETNGGRPIVQPHTLGRWPANLVHDGSEEVLAGFPDSKGAAGTVTGKEPSTGDRYVLSGLAGRHEPRVPRGDSGSAARFFYCAKASKGDRAGSKHPTVKPIALMRWLVRLITPPGGTVLDPFAGSGTTGQAAMEEGFDAVLIERETEYLADIRRRLGVMPSIEELLA